MPDRIFEQWNEEFRAPTDEREALEIAVKQQERLSDELAKHVGRVVGILGADIVISEPTFKEALEASTNIKVDGVFQVLPETDGANFFLKVA
jgi:hypothetical protein